MSDPATDRRFMALALALGRRNLGRTWPNPAVGCVIVAKGRIVGRGWTAPGGRPHAETRALEAAGERARGATAYVSLEPCAHHGRTPPCAEALAEAGIARVVIACEDPDRRVSGQGLAALRHAGIDVTTGVMEAEACAAHAGFLLHRTEGRPWLTLKLALTLDGRIATATGESRWITGPIARRRVHHMRLTHDAVLVGGGTARADDPDLTVRGFGPVAAPVRCIASRHANLPRGGRLAMSAAEAPAWILCHKPRISADAQAAWESLGVRLVDTALGPDGQIEPAAMLRTLGREGITRVLCEGGGALAAAFLAADLVDELAVFSAGLVLGAEARPAVSALGLERLADAARFRLVSAETIGGDVVHRWQRR